MGVGRHPGTCNDLVRHINETMMAVFDKRVTRTVRTEYRLRVPVHASEVYKALNTATNDVQEHVQRFPRATTAPEILVTQDGEHVIVYWEHEQAGGTTRGFADGCDRQQP